MKSLKGMIEAVNSMKVVASVRPVQRPDAPVTKVIKKLMKKPGQTWLVAKLGMEKRNTAISIARRLKVRGAKATMRTVQARAGVPRHIEVYAMWPES